MQKRSKREKRPKRLKTPKMLKTPKRPNNQKMLQKSVRKNCKSCDFGTARMLPPMNKNVGNISYNLRRTYMSYATLKTCKNPREDLENHAKRHKKTFGADQNQNILVDYQDQSNNKRYIKINGFERVLKDS